MYNYWSVQIIGPVNLPFPGHGKGSTGFDDTSVDSKRKKKDMIYINLEDLPNYEKKNRNSTVYVSDSIFLKLLI